MATPDPDLARKIVEAGPFVANNFWPTVWMAAVALTGGAVSFYQKVKNGNARAINITEFIGEMFTSAVVGVVTFWICKGFGVNEYLTAAGVAITGHMGARAIFIAEQYLSKRASK
jgi:hypothetical protein